MPSGGNIIITTNSILTSIYNSSTQVDHKKRTLTMKIKERKKERKKKKAAS